MKWRSMPAVSTARIGDYDRYLLRPVPTAVQPAGYELALHRLSRVLQPLIVLAYALLRLGGRVTPKSTGLMATCSSPTMEITSCAG